MRKKYSAEEKVRRSGPGKSDSVVRWTLYRQEDLTAMARRRMAPANSSWKPRRRSRC